MLKVTLYIQRDGSSANDDTIRIYEVDEYDDMVRVTYSTPELRKDAEFFMTVPNAMRYISDTLKSLRHDSSPFEHVQVTTQIHPSILYHVADLDDCCIRHLIEDTVEMAIRRPVSRVKKH